MLKKRAFLTAAAATLTLSMLSGCATGPTQTSVNLNITGAADMNGGAPAQVKVYYLADATGFAASDFFAVFGEPEATLGAKLLSTDTFQLAPGRTVTDAKTFAQAPAAIGVVAGFRDINGRFVAVRSLVAGAENPVRVTLSGNTVSIR